MVKFGRKFFFDRVHKKRNYTLPIIITGILVVAITATFLITRYYKENKPKDTTPKLVLKKSIEIEVYTELPSIKKYIKNIKNIKESDLEIVYPEDLLIEEDNSACENVEDQENCKKLIATSIGEYKITIKSNKLDKTDNKVTLKVTDTTAPNLTLKEFKITEGNSYKIEDFVQECTDNSKQACLYEYPTDDKDGETVIDYSKYTAAGEYKIKVIAKDSSNNKTDKIETKLIINAKPKEETVKPPVEKPKEETVKPPVEKPKTCKYGDLNYSNAYVISTKISNTECAISEEEATDLANPDGIHNNTKFLKEYNSTYLFDEFDKYELEGDISVVTKTGLVYNTSNKGVVGYYIVTEAYQKIGDVTVTLARYFIDENGNRVWKINLLNLK